MKGKHPYFSKPVVAPTAAAAARSPQQDILSKLPLHITFRCLSELPVQSLVAASQTCRRWRILCGEQALWYHQCRRHGFLPLVKERYPQSTVARDGFIRPRPMTTTTTVLSEGGKKEVSEEIGEVSAASTSTAGHRPTRGGGAVVGNSTTITGPSPLLRSTTTTSPHRFHLRLPDYLHCYQPLPPATRAAIHWDQEFQYYYRLETNWYRGQYKTRDYRGHSSVVLAVRIDPVRRLVFSGGRDHVIKVWSLDSNRCVRTLRAHTNAVSCLDYDRMSATLVSGSWDGTVLVWQLQGGELAVPTTAATATATTTTTTTTTSSSSPSSTTITTITTTATTNTTSPRRRLTDPRHCHHPALAHLNDDILAHLDQRPPWNASKTLGSPAFASLATRKPDFVRQHVLDHGDEVICLRYKKHEMAAGTGSGLVQIWDTVTGTCQSIFNLYPDEDVVIPEGGGNGPQIMTATTTTTTITATAPVAPRRPGSTTTRIPTAGDVIGSVDFDADFLYVGVGSSVVVCDRATRSVISYIGNHCSPVTSLKLDQSYLVSGAEDSSILVWHHHQSTQSPTNSRKPLQRLNRRNSSPSTNAFPFQRVEPHMLHGHLSGVRCLQTHGTKLCTGSYDKTIRVWSIRQREEGNILRLKGHNSDVNAIDMTESLIVSGSDDGLVKVWDFRNYEAFPRPLLVDGEGNLIPKRSKNSPAPSATAAAIVSTSPVAGSKPLVAPAGSSPVLIRKRKADETVGLPRSPPPSSHPRIAVTAIPAAPVLNKPLPVTTTTTPTPTRRSGKTVIMAPSPFVVTSASSSSPRTSRRPRRPATLTPTLAIPIFSSSPTTRGAGSPSPLSSPTRSVGGTSLAAINSRSSRSVSPYPTPALVRRSRMMATTTATAAITAVTATATTPEGIRSWSDACAFVLAAATEPLSCQAIYDRIRTSPVVGPAFTQRGRTPLNTLNHCLHRHSKGPHGRFLLQPTMVVGGRVNKPPSTNAPHLFRLNPAYRG
ncbi:hypothetical protein H4R33_005218 [Dimargaris cristalligena]|nr:hypothetical protein H4R33_005218 [Dimargaris cristalligena]